MCSVSDERPVGCWRVTCIVGLVDGRDVLLGGDCAAIGSDHTVSVRREPKIFRNGPALIGFSNSFRMGQLLRFALHVPSMRPDTDALDWIVREVVPAAREALRDGGFSEVRENVETGAGFLVAAYGRLFHVEEDFHVGETLDGFDAIGCGGPYALGALRATHGLCLAPEERVLRALRAAQHFSGGVREPFTTLRLLAPEGGAVAPSSRAARARKTAPTLTANTDV